MKTRIASLTILCLALAAVPASAQIGPMTTVRSTATSTLGPQLWIHGQRQLCRWGYVSHRFRVRRAEFSGDM